MWRNVYLRVAYDGTDFHGWQRQSGLRTVQEVLEATLQRVVRHTVDLVGSGRTDAGVHAAGHVCNFFTDRDIPVDRLRDALGARLPEDLEIVAARAVHPAFNARRSAVSKLYRYRIQHTRSRPVDQRKQRYTLQHWKELDLAKMQEAAGHFIGKMDFSAMTPKGTVRESMVRRVMRCDVERYFDEIRIDVEGEGFLYKQVRTMVGTIVEVGRGRWEPALVAEILESRDRDRAGPTALACGLSLEWVRYPPELLVELDCTVDSAPVNGPSQRPNVERTG